MQRRQVEEASDRLQRSNEQFDVEALEVVDEVLDDGQHAFGVDEFELGKLADVFQVATALVVDHEVHVYVLTQLLVLQEQRLLQPLRHVLVVGCCDRSDTAQKWRHQLVLLAVLEDVPH